MTDREKQIEEMANICYAHRREWSSHKQGFCYAQAEALYDNNYRKLDEVKLRIDLDDCTPEQINEIMEKFSKAAETSSFVAVPINNEEEIRKEVAKEILQEVIAILPKSNSWQWDDDLQKLCQKYCVEVDDE